MYIGLLRLMQYMRHYIVNYKDYKFPTSIVCALLWTLLNLWIVQRKETYSVKGEIYACNMKTTNKVNKNATLMPKNNLHNNW